MRIPTPLAGRRQQARRTVRGLGLVTAAALLGGALAGCGAAPVATQSRTGADQDLRSVAHTSRSQQAGAVRTAGSRVSLKRRLPPAGVRRGSLRGRRGENAGPDLSWPPLRTQQRGSAPDRFADRHCR